MIEAVFWEDFASSSYFLRFVLASFYTMQESNQTMKIIETEILIKADIDKLWKILTDYERYGEWNKFCPIAETTGKTGDPLKMTVYLRKGKPTVQTETMKENKPYKLGWGLNWGIFLKSHRLQTLEVIENGLVRYYTYDKLWGLLTPLVSFLYAKAIKEGFELTAKCLKEYAESRV